MTARLEKYITEQDLVEAWDGDSEKSIFRQPAVSSEVVEFDELGRRLADGLRDARDRTGLTHADVPRLLLASLGLWTV